MCIGQGDFENDCNCKIILRLFLTTGTTRWSKGVSAIGEYPISFEIEYSASMDRERQNGYSRAKRVVYAISNEQQQCHVISARSTPLLYTIQFHSFHIYLHCLPSLCSLTHFTNEHQPLNQTETTIQLQRTMSSSLSCVRFTRKPPNSAAPKYSTVS